MRKGTKTITTEISGYFADDGKFFEDEVECHNYEINPLMRELFNITFDSNFEKPKEVGDMIYFVPKNQKDIENFIDVNKTYGYSTEGISLNSPISIYKYNERNCEYIDMVKQCKELIAEINFLVPDTFPKTT